jgi:outer membrane protein OmpA-like peptidoglycan-associated protein
MMRLLVAFTASITLLAVHPESTRACGAKLAIKGYRFRRPTAGGAGRTPTGAGGARQPILTGPGGRTPEAAGGNEEARATPEAAAPKRKHAMPEKRTAEPTPPPTEPEHAAEPTQAKSEPEHAAEPSHKSEPTHEKAEPTPEQPEHPSEPTPAPTKYSGKMFDHIFFGGGSSVLTSEAKSHLDKNAKWLAANSDKSITVDGHASANGSAEVNQALSEARAEAVKNYLVEKGVDASRIQTNAYGMDRPEFKPGINPKNRRVVITVNN